MPPAPSPAPVTAPAVHSAARYGIATSFFIVGGIVGAVLGGYIASYKNLGVSPLSAGAQGVVTVTPPTSTTANAIVVGKIINLGSNAFTLEYRFSGSSDLHGATTTDTTFTWDAQKDTVFLAKRLTAPPVQGATTTVPAKIQSTQGTFASLAVGQMVSLTIKNGVKTVYVPSP